MAGLGLSARGFSFTLDILLLSRESVLYEMRDTPQHAPTKNPPAREVMRVSVPPQPPRQTVAPRVVMLSELHRYSSCSIDLAASLNSARASACDCSGCLRFSDNALSAVDCAMICFAS